MEKLIALIDSMLNRVFGCRHPLPARMGPFTDKANYSYVVCLNCSQQAEYSLKDFCIVTRAYKRMKRRQEALLAREEHNAQLSASQHAMV